MLTGILTEEKVLVEVPPSTSCAGRSLPRLTLTVNYNIILIAAVDANHMHIDIEKLGNPGWNWKNLHKYMARTEGWESNFLHSEKWSIHHADRITYRFTQPNEEVAKRIGISPDNWELGRQGPLKLNYPPTIPEGELIIQEVRLSNLGVHNMPLYLISYQVPRASRHSPCS